MSLGGSSPYQFPPAQDGSPFNSSARHYSSFSEAESRPGLTAEQVYERYPAAKKKRKRKCWQKCHKRGWVMLALLVSIALLIVFVSLFIHEKISNRGYWEPEPIFPPSVGSNSLVGFISPASPIFFEPGWNSSNYPGHVAEIVDGLSLRFEFATHAFETYGSLAGPDADRASDVMEMFKDPTVSFIISNRGGWGCNRIIDMLTYSSIATNPKPLMGYSDLTGLLNAIHTLTGLVTFHGPMGLDPWNNITYSYVSSIILRGEKAVLRNSPNYPDWQTITGGKARGRLIGGNLSVFVAMLGSTYLPPADAFSNYILFLEEVGEEPYVIDRYMTMLHLSGILDQVAGFVWGRCTACTASVPAHSFTWQEIIVQKIQPLGVPSFMGGMFGHDLSEQYVLPIGVMAELDADKGTITLLESAVTLPSFIRKLVYSL